MSSVRPTEPGGAEFIIRDASVLDIPLIRDLTHIIWPSAYNNILTPGQIDYMLDLMYSKDALRKQIEQLHHRFILCYEGNDAVGFASFSPAGEGVFKLHKIYILPDRQGKGIGRLMISHIIETIRREGAFTLDLNVNRHNPAKHFYESLDFVIIREEDIDIGSGYWMNDYVMRKLIR